VTDKRFGTVKYFNSDRGFGFLELDDGGDDTFIHITECRRNGIASLSVGDRVSFVIRDGRNGPAAVDVRLAA
jgi:cold shock protein